MTKSEIASFLAMTGNEIASFLNDEAAAGRGVIANEVKQSHDEE